MRLDKYLGNMGEGTRSELKKQIRSGNAKVNGNTVTDPGFHVSEGDSVRFAGHEVGYRKYDYYMLNKPSGVISASRDPKAETVVDLIDTNKRKGLFPVGRLDIDTEGLLLITNDGALAHRLLSPAHHVDKVYLARVKGKVTENEVKRFAEGISLSDFTADPAGLEILAAGDISEVRVTIHEGKFHQIKRMFGACEMKVLSLKRMKFGSLELDPVLEPGQWRELTGEEIKGLQNCSK